MRRLEASYLRENYGERKTRLQAAGDLAINPAIPLETRRRDESCCELAENLPRYGLETGKLNGEIVNVEF